ncbi:MAG TPA: ATP-binding protein, partial [Chloroflexia bacterium]|nr:ATP-binding protein [Chloroflexia bacterium]
MATAAPPGDDRSKQSARLKQFIDLDTPINIGVIGFLLVLGTVFPGLQVVPIFVLMVVLNIGALQWARRQLRRNNIDAAILAICVSLWIMVLTTTFVVPQIYPILILLVVWSVAVAFPYVNQRTLLSLMSIATGVAVISSLFSARPDPFGLLQIVPDAIFIGVNMLFVPVFTGFIFLFLWHYSKRLLETLEETRAANLALQESERSLESKVLERTAELAQKNGALLRSQEELAVARDKALEANRAKSEFLANMSHEIRTPMNGVIGMTGLLLDTPLTAEQHDFVETVRHSSDALLTIINDILDFSKIEAGRLELENQPFNLRECIEAALDLLAGRAAEKDLDLAYLIQVETPGMLIGDVTRLRQILVNLLSNAVKFTEHGEVVVSVTAEPAGEPAMPLNPSSPQPPTPNPPEYRLHFAVRDTGIGIPADRMDRLFRSFSQVDTSTTRKYGGTGLGLAISKRLAELMGGTMWVESTPGQGSTFQFTIRAASAAGPVPVYLTGSQPELRGKRLLIVDDNATNRRILTLQAHSWGMISQETASPREALAWIRGGATFDVAVLDMQMPEMDGVALAAEIRQVHDARRLPLVMLTSMGQREPEAASTPFAAYLHKPIKSSQLYNALIG